MSVQCGTDSPLTKPLEKEYIKLLLTKLSAELVSFAPLILLLAGGALLYFKKHKYLSPTLLHRAMVFVTDSTLISLLFLLISAASSAPTLMTAESCARISSCDECGTFSALHKLITN